MPNTSVEMNFAVKAPAALVMDQLADLQKFAELHPVIYKAQALGDNKYKIYERLRFGFIPFSFVYPASVNADPAARRINMKAEVMKLVKIDILISISESQGTSQVHETVSIRSALPVCNLVAGIFRRQHQQLYENMNRKFSPPGA